MLFLFGFMVVFRLFFTFFAFMLWPEYIGVVDVVSRIWIPAFAGMTQMKGRDDTEKGLG